MPVSKRVGKYPAHFFDIAALRKDQLPFIVSCDTPAQAKGLRLQLYGFTEALRAENNPDFARMDALLLRVEGNTLIIEDRDARDSFFVRALERAARENFTTRLDAPTPVSPASSEPPPAAPSAHDSLLEKYLKGEKP